MSEPTPSSRLLIWLAAYTGFPARRLPAAAEKLLFVAAAAAEDEEAQREASGPAFGIQRRVSEKESALRAHALRRSQAHFKCDNSAKV